MSTDTRTNIAQAALGYAALGWPIVLVHQKTPIGMCSCRNADCRNVGKHPRGGKGWQNRATCDEDKLTAMLERTPNTNIGVKLGPCESGGVIDVEFDCDEGRETADRIFGECHTPTYKSKRSVHRILKWTDNLPRQTKIERSGLDFRLGADKAVQSILPPSVHPSGVQYEWMPGLSPSEVEPIEMPAAAMELLQSADSNGQGDIDLLFDGVDEPHRHNAAKRVAGSIASGRRTEAEFVDGWLMLLGWNQLNRPPLPEDELLDEWKWVVNQEKKKGQTVNHEKLIQEIRAEMDHPGFAGIIQHGRADAKYDMLFVIDGATVKVPIDSTEKLRVVGAVSNRLWECIDHDLPVSQEGWYKIRRKLRKIMVVRPAPDETECLEDRLKDYVAALRVGYWDKTKGADGEWASLSKFTPENVVTGRPEPPKGDRAEEVKTHNVTSFFGTDGRLYLKLGDLQMWLAKNWNRIEQKKLTAALSRLGFAAEKVRASHDGKRYEARYWVRENGKLWVRGA